jgi:hypothetical protein
MVEQEEPMVEQRIIPEIKTHTKSIEQIINKSNSVLQDNDVKLIIENSNKESILHPRKVLKKKLRFKEDEIKNVRIEDNLLPKTFKQTNNIVIKDEIEETKSSSENKQFEFF